MLLASYVCIIKSYIVTTESTCMRVVTEMPCEAEEEVVMVVDGMGGADVVDHRSDEGVVEVATIEVGGAMEACRRNQHGRNVT